MKKSIKTFLKTAGKDNIAKSANPAIVRASTIYFDTIQEMRKHQKDIAKGKKSNIGIMEDREVRQQFSYKTYLKN